MGHVLCVIKRTCLVLEIRLVHFYSKFSLSVLSILLKQNLLFFNSFLCYKISLFYFVCGPNIGERAQLQGLPQTVVSRVQECLSKKHRTEHRTLKTQYVGILEKFSTKYKSHDRVGN